MIAKLIILVKRHQNDIILVLGMVLLSLLSFAAGYLVAKDQLKGPIEVWEATYDL